jgi:hypothetical protein
MFREGSAESSMDRPRPCQNDARCTQVITRILVHCKPGVPQVITRILVHCKPGVPR